MENSKNTTKSEVKLTEPVICYPGHITKCSKISKTARNILDIILILMRIDNFIYLDGEAVHNIRKLSTAYQGKNYTEQTIRNAIHELSKNELILKYKKKNYFINPTFFMKFSPGERRKKLMTDFFDMGILTLD